MNKRTLRLIFWASLFASQTHFLGCGRSQMMRNESQNPQPYRFVETPLPDPSSFKDPPLVLEQTSPIRLKKIHRLKDQQISVYRVEHRKESIVARQKNLSKVAINLPESYKEKIQAEPLPQQVSPRLCP